MELLLHPTTKHSVDNILASPSQAILLHAPAGSGKGLTAKYISSRLLNITLEQVDNSSKIKILSINPDGKEKRLSIENIREINGFLKLKTTGNSNYRRAVIVEDAQTMGHEAQNAFLKTLEEPPKDTIIILTTTNTELLLPTIQSRVQPLAILAPSKKATLDYFSVKYTVAEIEKAYLLSEGAIGLTTALLENQTDHQLVKNIELAKDVYRKNIFERLNLIDNIVKTIDISSFLLAMERVSHVALYNAVQKKDSSTKAWNKRAKLILESQGYLANNPNSKLLLSNLFINL
ncbi:AAA family ATPase [Candidatus Saccharibacteria bacterium]|nr:AAA family ATPase [Candidatus Saccharibacteria bacterium]